MDSTQDGVIGEAVILGSLGVRIGDAELPVTGPRHARTFVLLLLGAGRVVPVDRIVEAVWDDGGPATAVRQVQDAVSALRGRLSRLGAPADLIATHPGGYRLRSELLRVDVFEFERERATAAACSEPEDAVLALRRALALWRGPALLGLGGRVLEGEAARLEALRLSAHLTCLGLEVELGRHRAVADEVLTLQREHPYDEDLAHLAMLALYRSGRRGQALGLYRSVRDGLAGELGVEPGPALREIQRAILADEPSLAPPARPRPPATAVLEAPLVPRQLPADLADFIGRTAELERIEALLRTGGPGAPVVISALSGTGGVGKTTLAVHAAHRVAEHFPDGQLQVDLHGAHGPGAEPTAVLARLLRGLGVHEREIPHALEERGALYRSVLAERRVLVLLDDAADAAQVRPLLPGSGRSAVLVTSRSTLPGLDGAARLSVQILPPDQARLLLERILGHAALDAEPEAAETVLRACAGLPLAIRIAASRVAFEPGLELADLARELADQGARLEALEVEDRAVRASFAASYQGLPPDQARAFRLLSANEGPHVSREAAAALFGLEAAEARTLLSALARIHLIQPTEAGRYALHDLLRVYAGECAADGPDGELEEARERLLTWYLHTSAAAAKAFNPAQRHVSLSEPPAHCVPLVFSDFDQAHTWRRAEQPNLDAAVLSADRAGLHEITWKLPITLWRPYEYERDAVWLRANQLALAATRALGDRTAEGWVLNRLAAAYTAMGLFDESETCLREALEIRGELGDRRGQAACLVNMGHHLGQRGRAEEAISVLEHALEIYEAEGIVSGQNTAHKNLGATLDMLGHTDAALHHAVRAYELGRQIGSPQDEGLDLANLASMLHKVGRLAEAADYAERGYKIATATGNRIGTAVSAGVLAAACAERGETEPAAEFWREALDVFRACDDDRAYEVERRLADLDG